MKFCTIIESLYFEKKNSDFLASAAISSVGRPPMIAAINQLFSLIEMIIALFRFDKDLNFRFKCMVKSAPKHTTNKEVEHDPVTPGECLIVIYIFLKSLIF